MSDAGSEAGDLVAEDELVEELEPESEDESEDQADETVVDADETAAATAAEVDISTEIVDVDAAEAKVEKATLKHAETKSETKSETKEQRVRTIKRRRAPVAKRAKTLLEIANAPRDIIVVHPDERVTSDVLQVTEMAAVLGIRANQIAQFATKFTDAPTGMTDPLEIAKKELYDRRCPLVLRRKVGRDAHGRILIEEWKVREMAYL